MESRGAHFEDAFYGRHDIVFFMFEIIFWVGFVFSTLLAAFALSQCWGDKGQPLHTKIVFTVLIILLPVIGTIIYLKQQDELDAARSRNERQRRWRANEARRKK